MGHDQRGLKAPEKFENAAGLLAERESERDIVDRPEPITPLPNLPFPARSPTSDNVRNVFDSIDLRQIGRLTDYQSQTRKSEKKL